MEIESDESPQCEAVECSPGIHACMSEFSNIYMYKKIGSGTGLCTCGRFPVTKQPQSTYTYIYICILLRQCRRLLLRDPLSPTAWRQLGFRV